ncbi:MAG: DUF3795 domain-containing protein [Firmicutes bacterium]|nr:DUF3795 domain-containing protein [Bacillota bacterium]
MEYRDTLQHLSPCGLDCVRCTDYEHGEIKHLSARLLDLLGKYSRVAKMREETEPAFANYHHFEQILGHFAGASCSGCRGGNVKCFIECAAVTCHREQGVDYCFQCGDYPCDKQFSGRMREWWIRRNHRMKDIGVVGFYHEQRKQPRY